MRARRKLIASLLLIAVGGLLIASALLNLERPRELAEIRKIVAVTPDGTTIYADFYKPAELKSKDLAVFVHGYAGTRKYWRRMILSVVAKGIPCVALDLRGHGSSGGSMTVNVTAGGFSVGYREFEMDVKGIVEKVREEVLGWERLAVIGHSMGGGIAIYLGSVWKDVYAVVAISPALFGNYASPLSPKHELFIAGGEDTVVDPSYVRELYRMASNSSETEREVVTAYNTTRMFHLEEGASHAGIVSDPDVIKLVASWLEDKLIGSRSRTVVYSRALTPSYYLGTTLLMMGALVLLPRRGAHVGRKEPKDLLKAGALAPIYGALFLLPAVAALPLVLLIPGQPLCYAALLAVWSSTFALIKAHGLGVREVFSKGIREVRSAPRDIVAGIGIFAILAGARVLWDAVVYSPARPASPERAILFALYTLLLFPAFLSDEVVFRREVRGSFGEGVLSAILSALYYATLRVLSLVGAGILALVLLFIGKNKIFGIAPVSFYEIWLIPVVAEAVHISSRRATVAAVLNALLLASMLIWVSPLMVVLGSLTSLL